MRNFINYYWTLLFKPKENNIVSLITGGLLDDVMMDNLQYYLLDKPNITVNLHKEWNKHILDKLIVNQIILYKNNKYIIRKVKMTDTGDVITLDLE